MQNTLKTYRSYGQIGIFLAISLFIHFLIVFLLYKMPPESRNREVDQSPISTNILSPQESKDILNKLKGQIVDLVDDIKGQKPDKNTAFLSDKDRRVKRETQSAITGLNPNAPFTSFGGGERQDILSYGGKSKETERDTLSERGFGERQNSSKNSGENKLNLTPSDEDLSRFVARAPNNYLPDVEVGNATILNTWGFAYAGYYTRMKRQMESIWNPRSIMMRSSVERKSAYITSLNITLDSKGNLAKAKIEQSSGIKELDQEAIRTVTESSPFLNPPEGVISPDGLIHIPRWNFIISYRSSFF